MQDIIIVNYIVFAHVASARAKQNIAQCRIEARFYKACQGVERKAHLEYQEAVTSCQGDRSKYRCMGVDGMIHTGYTPRDGVKYCS